MLLDTTPQLFEVDLTQAGSVSAYRGPDFRKPVRRHFVDGYAARTTRPHDFPVFNGKYSTLCYLDQTLRALDAMPRDASLRGSLDGFDALFFHRPYHWMPISAVASVIAWGIVSDAMGGEAVEELEALCSSCGVVANEVLIEARRAPDLWGQAQRGDLDSSPFPHLASLARGVRKSDDFTAFLATKMRLGSEAMKEVGNLYTAALPAWLAAGFDQAAGELDELRGQRMLAMGYGSGDAAEAIPIRVMPGWRAAAKNIRFHGALAAPINLTQAEYESLHDQGELERTGQAESGFIVDRIGEANDPEFQDVGLEYYRWVAEG